MQAYKGKRCLSCRSHRRDGAVAPPLAACRTGAFMPVGYPTFSGCVLRILAKSPVQSRTQVMFVLPLACYTLLNDLWQSTFEPRNSTHSASMNFSPREGAET